MQHHWRYKKILLLEKARAIALDLRQAGKKIVTVNGSFDLLHAGHLDILEEAKQQGDRLFVGINSDASIQQGKGKDRPFIPQAERAALLAALSCVDYVLIIEADYFGEVPNVLLRTIHPHIHVNGSEYGQPQTWVEWPAMQDVGAGGYVVARRLGLATTDIIQRIKRAGS